MNVKTQGAAALDRDDIAADNETEITLGLLNAVQDDSQLTQRNAAERLGIALGLTNAYLKRCIAKGLIKVKQAPPKRYAYYLTPQGFAEKARLTAEYLSSSLRFFRRARSQCGDLLRRCAAERWQRVALAGTGDLAEIATLCAREEGIELIGIIDAAYSGESFAGLAVARNLGGLGAVDAVIVTDTKRAQATFDMLAAAMPAERLLAPQLLRVSRIRQRVEAD